MSERPDSSQTLSLSAARRHDRICDRFEAAWQGGAPLRIEDLLAEVPAEERPALFAELLRLECDYRGSACTPEEYRARFPDFAAQVDTVFRDADAGATGPFAEPVVPLSSER